MALGFVRSSGEDFAPSLRINSVSGEVIVAGSKKSSDGATWEKYEHDITLPAKFIFDLAEIKIGWMRFAAEGPSFALVKLGERLPPKPSDDHKQGFQVRCYSKEHGICLLANSSRTVGEAMDALHDQFLKEEKANTGKVPVVEIKGMKKIQVKTREGNKSYRQPNWSIVTWIARPEALDAAPVEEAPAPAKAEDDDF